MSASPPRDNDDGDGDGDGADSSASDGPGDDGVVEVARGGPRTARNAAVVVGVVLVLFIALLATRKSAEERVGFNPLLNKAMPRVTGTTMDGTTIDLDRYRGRWVVVNFFAAWCIPCREEHPELIKFAEEHDAKGDAVVVSIAFNDQPSAVQFFFAQNGGTWPVIVRDDGRAAIDFGVTGVPESFVVAPNQLVVDHFNGVTQAELDAVIARYPEAAPPPSSAGSTAVPRASGGAPGTTAPNAPNAPNGTAPR
jgi:cytochrome c biogenesis protein CcmG/thiol:disulfide interchange protein DsbE